MLKYLHIENIAVIEYSEIELKKGFNVLTGETGAGKSIVIDSINAVLGERTSKDLIRAGCDSAQVSALFGDFDDEVTERLSQYDITPDDDGNILITRKLSLTGKGYIKINGKPFTSSVLREAAQLIINIHGQHDNQALLNPDMHCDLLDAVADNWDKIREYYGEFKKLNAIRRELNSLELDEDEKERKIELLKYQIAELEEAQLKEGETDALKKQLSLAENAEATLKGLEFLNSVLSGDDEAEGSLSLLRDAYKKLISAENPQLDGVISSLGELCALSEDLRSRVGNLLMTDSFLELDADSINQRLDTLHRLMIKYGGNEKFCIEYLEKARLELEAIKLSDKRINELSEELEKSKLRLISLAEQVTNSRRVAAEHFEKNVCDILSYLNMPNVAFKVNITQGRYTKFGCDNVEFLISPNKGEGLKPLHKIASGGELSRTMLAIKSSLADRDRVDTMIFDEIDTGISGFAADKVASQLKKVSKNRQVICVTHLAQIAAKGDNHLLISKSSRQGRTFTKVEPLSYDERIVEIARIMSGKEISENVYNSAKELIDRSNY